MNDFEFEAKEGIEGVDWDTEDVVAGAVVLKVVELKVVVDSI